MGMTWERGDSQWESLFQDSHFWDSSLPFPIPIRQDHCESWKRHDVSIRATWLIHIWNMTHSYALHSEDHFETRLSPSPHRLPPESLSHVDTRLSPCFREPPTSRSFFLGCIELFPMSRLVSPRVSDLMTSHGEVGGWGRVPFSRNLMSPTPRRK